MSTLIVPTPVSAFSPVVFDEVDEQTVRERLLARTAYQEDGTVLAGDWVRLPDGTTLVQLATVDREWGSSTLADPRGRYYLESNGHLNYNDDDDKPWKGLPLRTLRPTDEFQDCVAYIYHHKRYRYGNEVSFTIPTRVWQCPWLRNTPEVPR